MASAAEWSRRVASWRRSGLSAEEFASGKDYRAKTLAWWSSELKRRERSRPARGGENALVRGAGEVRFARVHVVEPPADHRDRLCHPARSCAAPLSRGRQTQDHE